MSAPAPESYTPPLGLPPLTDEQVQRVAALLSTAQAAPTTPARTCERCGGPRPRENKRFCSDACYCGARVRTAPLDPEEAAIRAGMSTGQVMRRALAQRRAWDAEHATASEASA